jgi:predicted hotdog family 3-hydroxylacyl-ACP dehydratase
MPVITRTALAQMLPHGERMCLLNEVHAWDKSSIVCEACSHQDLTNPLRDRSGLSVVCGLEYAAQAMAVHCALTLGGAKATRGYLGSARELEFHTMRLDTFEQPLRIRAQRLLSEPGAAIYTFSVEGEGQILLRGRASVFLDYSEEQT